MSDQKFQSPIIMSQCCPKIKNYFILNKSKTPVPILNLQNLALYLGYSQNIYPGRPPNIKLRRTCTIRAGQYTLYIRPSKLRNSIFRPDYVQFVSQTRRDYYGFYVKFTPKYLHCRGNNPVATNPAFLSSTKQPVYPLPRDAILPWKLARNCKPRDLQEHP